MPHFTTSDGCKIYYEADGAGPNLIFIHGWGCNHKFFDFQTAHFAKNYRVIRYDQRGHGLSDRDEKAEKGLNLDRLGVDLHELIEHLGISETHLVGWSMGVSTVLSYVRRFGRQYLDRLCLIDMSPRIINSEDWKLGRACTFTAEDCLAFLSLIASDWPTAARFFAPHSLAIDCSPDAEVYKFAVEQILDNNPHIMLSLWLAMATDDLRESVPQITVPTLLAYGENGSEFSRVHGEWIAEHIGGRSELVTFPGCGHSLFREDPEAFNKALGDFLDS